MIIGLNTVANSITLTNTTKKGNYIARVFDFDYSLLPLDNKIRAIHEMLADEIVKELNKLYFISLKQELPQNLSLPRTERIRVPTNGRLSD